MRDRTGLVQSCGLRGTLPRVAVGGVIALSLLAYIAQRRLWRVDMKNKATGTEWPFPQNSHRLNNFVITFCNYFTGKGV